MLTFMKKMLDKLLHAVLSLFPVSPFAPLIREIADIPYLGVLNWFLPVSEMVSVGTLWLIAIGVYYAWMVVARWVKLLGD